MLVKLLNTLVQLPVFHTATPSLMCDPREGSLSGLEEEEIAGASGFELFIVMKFDCKFYVCRRLCDRLYPCHDLPYVLCSSCFKSCWTHLLSVVLFYGLMPLNFWTSLVP